MVAIALKAEEVGLDVFATGEHHNPPLVPSSPTTMLGYIAARTERLVLSTSTTLITTNDPVKIAEDFAMLQHLADGRVDLMMGRGNTGPVYPWFGKDIRQGINLAVENSGLFKSFFDAVSGFDKDALAGTPVLIAATGGTARHSLVLDHALRPLFAYLRAVVVPTGVYAASEDWGAQGLAERIERAGAELARIASPAATPTASPTASARPARKGASGGFGTVVPFEEQLAALRGE